MTDINTSHENENVYTAAENAAENTENAKEKLFTQDRLEEIIAQRLSRERKINESLLAVKTLLKNAAEKGLIGTGSYAEMADEFAEKLRKGSENTAQHNDAALTQDEENSANAAAEQENNVENTDTQEQSITEKEDGGELDFAATLCDIKARYPKEKIEKLFTGDLFERFAKGRSGSIREIVDDFFSFVSSMGQSACANEDALEYSSFASTAFSSPGTSCGELTLTKQQMEIAKSAGMSYREYAHLLESVPKRTRTVF